MVFRPPSWTPQLPEVPDTVPVCEFVLDERYGRRPFSESRDSYVCGLTGRSIGPEQQRRQVDRLARSLSRELGWKVNQGTEYDKVACIFAYNTIDVLSVSWAIHRLNGISSPANAAYSADEVRHQLQDSGAKAIFTVLPLLQVALEAAARAKLPRERVFICEMPNDPPAPDLAGLKPISQLIKEGDTLPAMDELQWESGQGSRQTAFLCYSSGTSGLPKGVMISHRNVIANTLQISLYDRSGPHPNIATRDVALGLMPQSHIYGLVVICHVSTYNGDTVVVLPKFDLQAYLRAIQQYQISTLYIVPPIIINMINNKDLLKKYDLSSVNAIFTGAAPLGKETAEQLSSLYPAWKIRQGYGLTESCTLVCSSHTEDIWFGSSGCLLPGFEVKIMHATSGEEVIEYNQPGELLVKSPSIVLGYLNNKQATADTFVDHPEGRFMRTGDVAEIRRSPNKNEHIWIVDRIKELIKVKGLQVAPAELEACLLSHPAVMDCAVVPKPDDRAGEVPKAFVVKSSLAQGSDVEIKQDIMEHVKKEKAHHKWLAGGIEFIDVIPKSPAGKILRRMLRDRERRSLSARL